MRDYRINIVRLKGSENKIDVKDFKDRKAFFQFRDKAYEERLKFECLECGQELSISKSSRNNLYFRHNPSSLDCLFKDSQFSKNDWEIYRKIIHSKESERHKLLKKSIGDKLRIVEGIDPEMLWIDDRYVIFDGEKRRPDVYCEFRGKKIVFEIQLSDLSPRYLIERKLFYKKHGIYLIWILDNFKYLDQTNFELKIKYLSGHQNFFHFNEFETEFKLDCRYKKNYIFDEKEVHQKWEESTIGLESLIFDDIHKEVYYYHFENGKKCKESYLILLKEKKLLAIAESKKILEQELINTRVEKFVSELGEYHKNEYLDYTYFYRYLENCGIGELQILNKRIGLENKPCILPNSVEKFQKKDFHFLNFILDAVQIKMDINFKKDNGKTLFEIIVANKEYSFDHLLPLVKSLLFRGFVLQKTDLEVWTQRGFDQKDFSWYYLFELFAGGQHLDVMEKVFKRKYGVVVLMIESIKRDQFLHFNYGSPSSIGSWVAFANNALQYYSEFWEFIQLAFLHYGKWDDVVSYDLGNKQSLKKKLDRYHIDKPQLDEEFIEVFFELYEHAYESYPTLKQSHNHHLIDWRYYDL